MSTKGNLFYGNNWVVNMDYHNLDEIEIKWDHEHSGCENCGHGNSKSEQSVEIPTWVWEKIVKAIAEKGK